ncbi:MAG TPA: DsbA family oxidoreductase [Amaricoccus sp.]|nr:DsbA family oxidoreductase [Amaricoccus sp.]
MTRLEIVSDVVCPWCYLGAANLMRAVTAQEGHPFAIRWRPFQLDPTIPPEGMDRTDYMTRKFGDLSRIEASHQRLVEMGREVGIEFRFERIARSPNTLDAHRVIRWAEPEGLQTRTAMALFRRYFELGEDVSDPAVLRAAAEEAGLDGAAIAALLAGDADRAEVQAEVAAAQDMGVTGVPTFVIAGQYVLSGAQPVEVWSDVIRQLEAATPAAT